MVLNMYTVYVLEYFRRDTDNTSCILVSDVTRATIGYHGENKPARNFRSVSTPSCMVCMRSRFKTRYVPCL